MKNLFILLSFLILFQSCFTYKTVNYDEILNDKKQKLEVEMLDRTKFSGQLVSADEITMTLENNGIKQLSLRKIFTKSKSKSFQFLKP